MKRGVSFREALFLAALVCSCLLLVFAVGEHCIRRQRAQSAAVEVSGRLEASPEASSVHISRPAFRASAPAFTPGTAPKAIDPKVAERLRKAGFRTDGFSPVSTTVRSK